MPPLPQGSGQCSRWPYTNTVIPCLLCGSQEEGYKLRSQCLCRRVSWAEELGSVTLSSRTVTLHATELSGLGPHLASLMMQCWGNHLRMSPTHPGGFSGPWGLACELLTPLCSVSRLYSQSPHAARKCAPHSAPFAHGQSSRYSPVLWMDPGLHECRCQLSCYIPSPQPPSVQHTEEAFAFGTVSLSSSARL